MRHFFFALLAFIFCSTLSAQSCLPGGIAFIYQEQIDAFAADYPDCTCIEGNIRLYGDEISSLAGLSQITQIKGNLHIDYLTTPDFTGLNNLTSIGGRLTIYGTTASTTSGFEGLIYVGGYVHTRFNEFTNMNGFQNLGEVGLGFFLSKNDNLSSLNGLNSLRKIGTAMWIFDNLRLNDISSLDNVTNNGLVSVLIKDNPNLPVCSVTPVCDFLDNGGYADISNNAPGCNSQPDVRCDLCAGGTGVYVTVQEDVFIYSDMDLMVDGVGVSPGMALEIPQLGDDITCSNIMLRAFFRVMGASCESDIEVSISDPAGSPIFLGNVFATCEGSGSSPFGKLYEVNLPIPVATNVEPGNWMIRFSDSNDQNSGIEFLVGFLSLDANCEYRTCENNLENREEELPLEEVRLYPVPADEYLNIDYDADNTRLLSYEIFTPNGKSATRGEEFVVKGKNTFQVDITTLPVGHYYIKMSDNNNVTQTKPFVKM